MAGLQEAASSQLELQGLYAAILLVVSIASGPGLGAGANQPGIWGSGAPKAKTLLLDVSYHSVSSVDISKELRQASSSRRLGVSAGQYAGYGGQQPAADPYMPAIPAPLLAPGAAITSVEVRSAPAVTYCQAALHMEVPGGAEG